MLNVLAKVRACVRSMLAAGQQQQHYLGSPWPRTTELHLRSCCEHKHLPRRHVSRWEAESKVCHWQVVEHLIQELLQACLPAQLGRLLYWACKVGLLLSICNLCLCLCWLSLCLVEHGNRGRIMQLSTALMHSCGAEPCGELSGRLQLQHICLWPDWKWQDLHHARISWRS